MSNSERFTLEIDKRIIEGFVDNQHKTLEALAASGFSRDAVLKRARGLGLTQDFLDQCQTNGVVFSVRECLRCERLFLSMGPQNRSCRRCHVRRKQ